MGMNMKPALRCLGIVVGLMASAAFLAGCGTCKPGKSPGPPLAYNIKISPGDSLRDSSLEVDLIGIHPSDLERYRTYSVKKYFKPGDPLRADASKFTVKFVPGQQNVATLPKNHTLWSAWMKAGVQYIVVLADIPGVADEGKPGTQDPRRQLIPICECYWPNKTQELEIKVQAGGVNLTNTPREGWSLPVW